LGGITPALSQNAAEVVCRIEIAHEMGLTISTDLNYRANCGLWQTTQRRNARNVEVQ
jgi:2-dehydro-3-deoxygluconokinase